MIPFKYLKNNPKIPLIIIIIFLLNFLWVYPGFSHDKVNHKELTVLFTNDIHDQLKPFDTKDEKNIGGMATIAFIFEKIRKEKPFSTLVLDAGDYFQGSPLYNFFKGEIDLKVMSMAGYDATIVGNHDLDDGIDNLRKQSQYTSFPILCANLTDENDLLIFRPFNIFRVNGLNIGVIGLLGKEAWSVVGVKLKTGLKFLEPLETLKKVVPIVREYSDIVILLSHSGHEDDMKFGTEISGIDIIIGSHSHKVIEEPVFIPNKNENGINGTIMQQAGCNGMYVGRIDLEIENNKIIKNYKGVLIPVKVEMGVKPEINTEIAKYSDQIEEKMNIIIGENTEDIDATQKYKGESDLGNLITDVMRNKFNTDIAFVNSGGIRSDLPKGKIQVKTIYKILPFENSIVTFKCNGEKIKKILEMNTERFGKQGTFQFSGIKCVIVNGKVTEITVNDKKLDLNKVYSVATVDFIFDGGEKYNFKEGATDVYYTGIPLRDIFINYIKEVKKIKVPQSGRLIIK